MFRSAHINAHTTRTQTHLLPPPTHTTSTPHFPIPFSLANNITNLLSMPVVLLSAQLLPRQAVNGSKIEFITPEFMTDRQTYGHYHCHKQETKTKTKRGRLAKPQKHGRSLFVLMRIIQSFDGDVFHYPII